MKVGDVVIFMFTDTPRGKWPLGTIVKVYPGKDSKVRVVDVQVGSTIIATADSETLPFVTVLKL